MKKTYTLIVAGLLAAGSAFAQGSVFLNNYDANNGLGRGIFNGTVSAAAGTFVEVLGGPVAGSLTPITSTGGASKYTITAGDVNANGAGTGSFFDFGFGFAQGVTASGSADLMVRAWIGAATYDLALTRGSVRWTQNVGDNPAPPTLPNAAKLLMPGTVVMTLVPEPSAIVLGILGAAALLLRRRK